MSYPYQEKDGTILIRRKYVASRRYNYSAVDEELLYEDGTVRVSKTVAVGMTKSVAQQLADWMNEAYDQGVTDHIELRKIRIG